MVETNEERKRLIAEKGLVAPALVTIEGLFGNGDGQDVVRGYSEDGFVLTERHGRVDPEYVHRAS